MTRRGFKMFFFGIGGLGILFFVVLLFLPLLTSFSICTSTEILAVNVSGTVKSNPALVLRRVNIYDGDEGDPSLRQVSCQIGVGIPDSVTFQRIGSGKLVIWIHADTPIPVLDSMGEPMKVMGNFLTIELDNLRERAEAGEGTTFTLNGKFYLGRFKRFGAGFESQSVLRSGKIAYTGISPWTNERFYAGDFELEPGDQIEVGSVAAPAFGQIILNEEPAMKSVTTATADEVKVLRLGMFSDDQAYSVSADRLDRMIKGPFSQMYSLLVGVLVAALTFAYESYAFYKAIYPDR